MDEANKLPADKVDALAERLQGSLKRRRPRTWLIVLSVTVLALVVLGLSAWWFSDRSEPVRLEIVVFDQVVAPDESPRVAAQLAFPDKGDYSPALLRGRDMVFLDARSVLLPGQQGTHLRTTSDADGRASVEWPRLAGGQPERVVARYIDTRYKQGSTDQANLTPLERDSRILLVDVEETLAQLDPAQWENTHAADIKPQPGAATALREAEKKKYRIAYLTVHAGNPLAYRKVRGWMHAPRPDKERFPSGPVLGRPGDAATTDVDPTRWAVLQDLKNRFGEHITMITNNVAGAAAGRKIGIRVVTIFCPAPAPNATNLRTWDELPGRLEP
jgi:hypothetical protein